jgi:hypothetical protein
MDALPLIIVLLDIPDSEDYARFNSTTGFACQGGNLDEAYPASFHRG